MSKLFVSSRVPERVSVPFGFMLSIEFTNTLEQLRNIAS